MKLNVSPDGAGAAGRWSQAPCPCCLLARSPHEPKHRHVISSEPRRAQLKVVMINNAIKRLRRRFTT